MKLKQRKKRKYIDSVTKNEFTKINDFLFPCISNDGSWDEIVVRIFSITKPTGDKLTAGVMIYYKDPGFCSRIVGRKYWVEDDTNSVSKELEQVTIKLCGHTFPHDSLRQDDVDACTGLMYYIDHLN